MSQGTQETTTQGESTLQRAPRNETGTQSEVENAGLFDIHDFNGGIDINRTQDEFSMYPMHAFAITQEMTKEQTARELVRTEGSWVIMSYTKSEALNSVNITKLLQIFKQCLFGLVGLKYLFDFWNRIQLNVDRKYQENLQFIL